MEASAQASVTASALCVASPDRLSNWLRLAGWDQQPDQLLIARLEQSGGVQGAGCNLRPDVGGLTGANV